MDKKMCISLSKSEYCIPRKTSFMSLSEIRYVSKSILDIKIDFVANNKTIIII